MATEKQRAAARRNIKKAQAAAAMKRISARLPKATKSTLSIGDNVVFVAFALVWLLVILVSVAVRPDGTVPAGGRLVATASPRAALLTATTASTNPVAQATQSTPGSPAPGTTSAVPTATAETGDRVALRTDTLVAQAWRDIAGTVRVHVVVSATNDTSAARSLATAARTFRLISAAGQTFHTGRFPYAFPFVVPPGATSHLITTVVLPVGVDATDLRVEADILADITTVLQPMLEVSDLRLVSSEGRPGVRGIVRNTSAEDVTFGVVAVIGRDASGRVIGGFYDNVNIASIVAGGEATFQTEYPGIPPETASRIADLSGVAFDVESSLLR